MTHDEFKALVAEMRHAQRRYFNARTFENLEEAKRLERLVDEALKDDRQKPLFGDEAKA